MLLKDLMALSTGPGDFVPQTATIFLTAAEVEAGTLKCFTINITDDQIVEDPESIVYQIVNTDPPGITISNEEEFTINDNDSAYSNHCYNVLVLYLFIYSAYYFIGKRGAICFRRRWRNDNGLLSFCWSFWWARKRISY